MMVILYCASRALADVSKIIHAIRSFPVTPCKGNQIKCDRRHAQQPADE
jgi:hypothetical protein